MQLWQKGCCGDGDGVASCYMLLHAACNMPQSTSIGCCLLSANVLADVLCCSCFLNCLLFFCYCCCCSCCLLLLKPFVDSLRVNICYQVRLRIVKASKTLWNAFCVYTRTLHEQSTALLSACHERTPGRRNGYIANINRNSNRKKLT